MVLRGGFLGQPSEGLGQEALAPGRWGGHAAGPKLAEAVGVGAARGCPGLCSQHL